MDILYGVAYLAAHKDEEPEDIEAEHENRDDPERTEQALGQEHAPEIQNPEQVVRREQEADHDGARQRRAPPDPGVGNRVVERHQHRRNQDPARTAHNEPRGQPPPGGPPPPPPPTPPPPQNPDKTPPPTKKRPRGE